MEELSLNEHGDDRHIDLSSTSPCAVPCLRIILHLVLTLKSVRTWQLLSSDICSFVAGVS